MIKPPSLNPFIYFHVPVPAEDDGGSHEQGEDEIELLLVFSQVVLKRMVIVLRRALGRKRVRKVETRPFPSS